MRGHIMSRSYGRIIEPAISFRRALGPSTQRVAWPCKRTDRPIREELSQRSAPAAAAGSVKEAFANADHWRVGHPRLFASHRANRVAQLSALTPPPNGTGEPRCLKR